MNPRSARADRAVAVKQTEPQPYDLVTVGEAMLRLSPRDWQRLEQANCLELHIAGSELNVAVLLARLGLKVAWTSRLPQHPLGRLVSGRASAHGVDVSHIAWSPEGRIGVMYYEPGPPPRSTHVIYDRAHSLASELALSDMDWPALLERTRRLHLTGITPALSAVNRAFVLDLAKLAHARGVPVSFDLNYRRALSSPLEARAVFEGLVPWIDTALIAERDAVKILGAPRGAHAAASELARRYALRTVAVTCGPDDADSGIVHHDGKTHRAPRHPTTVIDRLGAGDSFAAGVLFGLLRGDVSHGAQLAGYLSALAIATPGDLNWVSPEDLVGLVEDRVAVLER
jgi:2-dehydro-3-deoxygluconokinase